MKEITRDDVVYKIQYYFLFSFFFRFLLFFFNFGARAIPFTVSKGRQFDDLSSGKLPIFFNAAADRLTRSFGRHFEHIERALILITLPFLFILIFIRYTNIIACVLVCIIGMYLCVDDDDYDGV